VTGVHLAEMSVARPKHHRDLDVSDLETKCGKLSSQIELATLQSTEH